MNYPRIPDEILNKPVEQLFYESGVDASSAPQVRMLKMIQQNDGSNLIITVRDLLSYARPYYASMPNEGQASIEELDRILAHHHLELPIRHGAPPYYKGAPCQLAWRKDGYDSIFSLAFNESLNLDSCTNILRVPGGWLYSIEGRANHSICFVPDKGNTYGPR